MSNLDKKKLSSQVNKGEEIGRFMERAARYILSSPPEEHQSLTKFVHYTIGHGLTLVLAEACTYLAAGWSRRLKQENEPREHFKMDVKVYEPDYSSIAFRTVAYLLANTRADNEIALAFVKCTLPMETLSDVLLQYEERVVGVLGELRFITCA